MNLPDLKNIELLREGAVLVATIARPEAMNALNTETLKSIAGAYRFC